MSLKECVEQNVDTTCVVLPVLVEKKKDDEKHVLGDEVGKVEKGGL